MGLHLTLFIVLHGIQANMGTDFKQRRRTLSVLALVATICWSAIAGRTVAKAQEPPSIIGSSPLYGLSGATGWNGRLGNPAFRRDSQRSDWPIALPGARFTTRSPWLAKTLFPAYASSTDTAEKLAASKIQAKVTSG